MQMLHTLLSCLMLACISLTACSAKVANKATQSSTPPAGARQVSVADLAKLRWIEGTWRGTGDVEKPFYERYRFENDTTLMVETFDNEKVGKVSDSTRFELQDGQFGNGGNDARWAAISIDDHSITFAPVAKAKNSFRWQQAGKDLWQAILTWPAADNKPERQRVYRMERWSPSR